MKIIPQKVLATGVLISNRGEGDEPLCSIGRGKRVPLLTAKIHYTKIGFAIWGLCCSIFFNICFERWVIRKKLIQKKNNNIMLKLD